MDKAIRRKKIKKETKVKDKETKDEKIEIVFNNLLSAIDEYSKLLDDKKDNIIWKDFGVKQKKIEEIIEKTSGV